MSNFVPANADVYVDDLGPFCEIPLSRGLTAKVDPEDYERLSEWKWHASDVNKNGRPYAARGRRKCEGKPGLVYLHRVVLEAPEGAVVDHIARDELDCRKANLRLVTQAANSRNRRLSRNNTSGFVGVTWNKRAEKWSARARLDGRNVELGKFATRKGAAEARDEFVRTHYGAFGTYNLPKPGERSAITGEIVPVVEPSYVLH